MGKIIFCQNYFCLCICFLDHIIYIFSILGGWNGWVLKSMEGFPNMKYGFAKIILMSQLRGSNKTKTFIFHEQLKLLYRQFGLQIFSLTSCVCRNITTITFPVLTLGYNASLPKSGYIIMYYF